MKKTFIFNIIMLLLMGFSAQSCSDNDNEASMASRLTVTKDNIEVSELQFGHAATSAILGVCTDGDWTAESTDTTWCKLQIHAGYGIENAEESSYTRVMVSKNSGNDARSASITFKSGDISKTILVIQKGTGTDPNDPFISATTFVENIRLGYNLGNTLESNPIGDWWNPVGKQPIDWETQWGQPETTQEIIDTIAKKGFNVIRVPVTWGIHCDESGTIDEAWMNRVQEVVDMVLKAGCYCILNVQHDNGSAQNRWLYADMADYPAISTRFQYLWQQIANRFRDYDEHLVFEAYNEILSKANEWGDPADATCYEAANKLLQDFVNVVRTTGGNNEYRNLLVNPYGAGHSTAKLNGMQLPTDVHPSHLMCSIHSYDPWAFCNDDEASSQWYIYMFDDNCKQEIDDIFARVHKRFAEDFGVPYFFGEFGALGTHVSMGERVKYAQYMAQKFNQYDITGLWWMGLLDRRTLVWTEAEIVDALLKGINR